MKRCSACNRTYSDDTLRFCLDDGNALRPLQDADATLVIPGEVSPTKRTSKNLIYFIVFSAVGVLALGLLALYGPWTRSANLSSGAPSTSSPSQFMAAQPRGVWVGQSRTVDRGMVRNSSITVDFDQHIASDGECPENRGRLINVDADTITIEWGQCGREVVKYSIHGSTLAAEGATVDIAGNRSNKRTWTLTQQRA